MGEKQPNGTKPEEIKQSRRGRTAETAKDGSAIGHWHFCVITKATAGCKHKKQFSWNSSPTATFCFAIQARPSEMAESN